ncbi:MAG TPA: hypothetical protein VN436_14540 [Holophaga sp.]|nr:hypothetical protein [Holophaga sp.]
MRVPCLVLWRIASTLLLVVTLACGGGGSGSGGGGGTDAPTITSFTVSPQRITASQDVTLAWTVSGATELKLDPGAAAVTGTGDTRAVTGTTTFTLTATNSQGTATAQATVTLASAGTAKIAYLHHSTGGCVWDGGVPGFFTSYNQANGTDYGITSITYPDTSNGYPWANYPYDYWNLWVRHTGSSQDQQELNLDQLAAQYDVIVFKHCFPVSAIGPDSDCVPASVSSEVKTVANYKLQYEALKARMKAFPGTKFIVWTGAALKQGETTEAQALRAKAFFDWVKASWDVPGDNIFVWDFWTLETAGTTGTLYLNDAYAQGDSHPADAFCRTVAPFVSRRIVDVIEGRGDTGTLTGQ